MNKNDYNADRLLSRFFLSHGACRFALLSGATAALLLSGCGGTKPTDVPAQSEAPREQTETTATAEGSLFAGEGAPVAVNGISGLVTLASPTEMRIVVGIQNGRPMLPFMRAAALLPGREDAPLSSTRSANDRYISIMLPDPVTPPVSIPLLLIDARTGTETRSTVRLDKISPSDDDLVLDGVERTGDAAKLEQGLNRLLQRMVFASNGGDYELAAHLIPTVVELANEYARVAGKTGPETQRILTALADAQTTIIESAKTIDDGGMGTSVETVQLELIPALIARDGATSGGDALR